MLEVNKATMRVSSQELFCRLSFSVADGELVCVRGASGTGKTSLLRAILGFAPLSEGYVSIDGEPMTPYSAPQFRTHIAYLPQEPQLPVETAEQMTRLLFTLKANAGRQWTKDALMEQWRQLDLTDDLLQRRATELSGGQRQRALLGVCGMLDKPIIIADEPTSALDSETTQLAANYLRRQANGGRAVLVVSHDDIVARCADKLIELGIKN